MGNFTKHKEIDFILDVIDDCFRDQPLLEACSSVLDQVQLDPSSRGMMWELFCSSFYRAIGSNFVAGNSRQYWLNIQFPETKLY